MHLLNEARRNGGAFYTNISLSPAGKLVTKNPNGPRDTSKKFAREEFTGVLRCRFSFHIHTCWFATCT